MGDGGDAIFDILIKLDRPLTTQTPRPLSTQGRRGLGMRKLNLGIQVKLKVFFV